MPQADELLRKLEPMIGEGMSRRLWIALRDSKLRRTAELYITKRAEELLDETYKHDKVLLPPPDPADLSGTIDAGEVWYDGPRGRLGLRERELVKHVGVVGASGYGKSTLAMKLVRSVAASGKRVIVFDVKRTWRSLVDVVPEEDARVYTLSRPAVSPFRFNPLIPPSNVPAELFDQVMCRIGDEVLYGGLGSHSIIKAATEALRQSHPMPAAAENHFTMADLLREVQKFAGQMRMRNRAGDWASTAIRIASELASQPLGSVINTRRNAFDADIESARLVVFEMDLFSQAQYTWFVTSFLVREYLKRLDTSKPDELDMLIVFEEAARIFCQPYPQPQFDTMLREVREKGVGIMWLNQEASTVNATAWANTSNLFVFRQISGKDINAVGSAVVFEKPAEKRYVSQLRTGECIVRIPDRFRLPFMLRTDDIPKTVVSDARVHELASARLAAMGIAFEEQGPVPAVPGDKEPVIKPAAPLVVQRPEAHGAPDAPVRHVPVFASKAEEYLAAQAHMLAEVRRSPGLSASQIYSRIGLPKSRGHKVKERLVASGLASESRVPGIGGTQVHLSVGTRGAEFLDAHAALLDKPLVRWSTRRFGGPKSRELGELAKQHFSARGATLVGEEVDDGFHGRWDQKWTDARGSEFVVELVTGESKRYEIIHVRKALSAGLPIFLFCYDDGIAARIRRYLADESIAEDGTNVSVLVPESSGVQHGLTSKQNV